jgi:hypothetical protein
MPIPTWSVGQVLASSDVNSWFVPLAVVKPSDTARSSTTSLSNDPALVLPLAGASTYEIRGMIFYTGPTAGSSDIQWKFNMPAGNVGQYFSAHQNLSGVFAGAFQNNWTDTVTANTNGVSTVMCDIIYGITRTVSGGNMQLLWAQNTSNATNTTVRAQSFLVAQRIG